jgi:hypothetical protein
MSEELSVANASAVPAAPSAEYDAICDALMQTARGRWFLEEYARRNRSADTLVLLSAIERIESAVCAERDSRAQHEFRSDLLEMANAITRTRAEVAEISSEAPAPSRSAPIAAPQPGDIFAAAERIRDVTWAMRGHGFDPSTCDQLEALAAAILSASALRDPTDHRAAKLSGVLQYLEHRIGTLLQDGAGTSAMPVREGDEAPIGETSAEAEPDEEAATLAVAELARNDEAQPPAPSPTIEPLEEALKPPAIEAEPADLTVSAIAEIEEAAEEPAPTIAASTAVPEAAILAAVAAALEVEVEGAAETAEAVAEIEPESLTETIGELAPPAHAAAVPPLPSGAETGEIAVLAVLDLADEAPPAADQTMSEAGDMNGAALIEVLQPPPPPELVLEPAELATEGAETAETPTASVEDAQALLPAIELNDADRGDIAPRDFSLVDSLHVDVSHVGVSHDEDLALVDLAPPPPSPRPVAALPPAPQLPRDPLAALKAMSEEELIALFS